MTFYFLVSCVNAMMLCMILPVRVLRLVTVEAVSGVAWPGLLAVSGARQGSGRAGGQAGGRAGRQAGRQAGNTTRLVA